ncbi:MAG: hypothetical protein P8N09_00045 [Planctomycetota bacterium]|nr:hypothetical protein [Planctomycetota bacterium]
MRHVLKSTLIVTFLFVFSASFVHAQLSVDVPVLRSNSKGVYSAFKAKGNAEFDVVVRLYEDADKKVAYQDALGDPWAETLHFAVQGKQLLGSSDPLGGDYVLYVPVNGFLSLLIGATEELPDELSGTFIYCTTQVTPYKKGVAKTPYAESPTQIIRSRAGSQEILDYMSLVNLDDGLGGTVTTIRIEGANLQIVNGTDATGGAVNGLGNLIVGYNELGNLDGDDRTGSHNIVTGQKNSFPSYGGLVAGASNTVSGRWSSVSSGYRNTASGEWSSVSGGTYNTASGYASSASGGFTNTASGELTSVSGGHANTASDQYASVSGGHSNNASGYWSSVSGGYSNTASGLHSSVSSGRYNDASGSYSSVSGGGNNFASGDLASVSGGRYNTASDWYSSVSGGGYNSASGYYSSVSGGFYNTASGAYSSVSGGTENEASGKESSVSGGRTNEASGNYSSVSGGDSNTASSFASSVSGGNNNTASGSRSSVSGGNGRSASDSFNWAAGSLSESN